MTQNNLKIAITGGIGSGKSSVSQIIKGEGFPVFSCDKIYVELLQDPAFLSKIEAEFGGVLNADGSLNRAALAFKVFSDKQRLKKLNELTHPDIISAALQKMEGYKISFLEVPLLFENGFQTLFDGVIVVNRDLKERISSVAERDNIPPEDVILRIKSQLDYEKFDFSEYYVIHNCSNFSDLRQKTLKILKKIIQ